MNKVRRQHYVWRNYLRPWAVQESIYCCRDHKIFNTGLMNVAQERDFYTSEPITLEDERDIRKVAVDDIKNSELKRLAEEWISFAKVPHEVISFAQKHAPNETDLHNDLEISQHNFGESLQGKVEDEGRPFLEKLLQEDMTFYEDESSRHSFGLYIAFQYFRTKNMFERMSYDPEKRIENGRLDRIWPILRNIFSTNLGFGLVQNPDKIRLVYLKNETQLQFITSDQPAINTYADYQRRTPVNGMEFYYPISPTRAILLTDKQIYQKYQVVHLDRIDDVNDLNRKIINASSELVFASVKDTLKIYFPMVNEA